MNALSEITSLQFERQRRNIATHALGIAQKIYSWGCGATTDTTLGGQIDYYADGWRCVPLDSQLAVKGLFNEKFPGGIDQDLSGWSRDEIREKIQPLASQFAADLRAIDKRIARAAKVAS